MRRALAEFDAAQCPDVPCSVFPGQRFWGKDRVADLVEAVEQAGIPPTRADREGFRREVSRTHG